MKKKEINEQLEVEPVRLKPWRNMSAATYLTIIYALAIIVIVFAVGFLPGIIHGGRQVTFKSSVKPSSVYVDAAYAGTTPFTAFLSPGEHSVRFSYKDIAQESFTIEVDHPLFLTWLIPRKMEISSTSYLDAEAADSYLKSMMEEIVSYSKVIDYGDSYHYPPLFEMAAYTLSSIENADPSLLSYFTDGALFITSETMLQDYRNAVEILDQASFDVASLTEAGELLSLLFDENQTGKSPALRNDLIDTALSVEKMEHPFNIEGYRFPAQKFYMGKDSDLHYPGVQQMGVETEVSSFVLSSNEISEYQWALFIEAHPMWAKSNSEQLTELKLADESYLDGIYPNTAIQSASPVRNISYYAASAFAEWVSEQSGKEVFIPTAAHLELASLMSDGFYQSTLFNSSDKTDGPSSLLGGVWEFTSTEFVPLSRYLGRTVETDITVDDIVVKGGSYLNDPDLIDSSTVGVLNKSQCSDTAGFRIAWK